MCQVNNRNTYTGVKRFRVNNKDTRTASLTAGNYITVDIIVIQNKFLFEG